MQNVICYLVNKKKLLPANILKSEIGMIYRKIKTTHLILLTAPLLRYV
jgi:hypothetical protein